MALHHLKDNLNCPLCEQKLLDAHSDLSRWFKLFVKPHFSNCHISWSFRCQEEQEKAVSEGKSLLHYPLSPHNHKGPDGKPLSLALDLFFITADGLALFPYKEYKNVAESSALSGYKIYWGGLYKTLGDYDHFQLNLGTPHSLS